MEQEIRFCTTKDGVRIAYSSVGDGPAFVKAANWMNHLELDWQSPVWRHLVQEFAQDHRFVRYDERGNGLSDRKVADLSLDAFVNDLESVVDAIGLDRFPLFGISQGGPVAVEYTFRHPDKVSHLILLGAFATGWKRIPELSAATRERRDAEITLIKQGWENENPAFRQFWTTLCIPDATPEESTSFNELQRMTVTAETAAAIFEALGEIDVFDRLAKLDLPVLVLHSTNDSVVTFNDGRRVASAIKGARFVPLESRNHLLLSHEPAWPVFVNEVRRFLGRTLSSSEQGKFCRTCGRTYGGDLFFCLDDGTKLETDSPEPETRIL